MLTVNRQTHLFFKFTFVFTFTFTFLTLCSIIYNTLRIIDVTVFGATAFKSQKRWSALGLIFILSKQIYLIKIKFS